MSEEELKICPDCHTKTIKLRVFDGGYYCKSCTYCFDESYCHAFNKGYEVFQAELTTTREKLAGAEGEVEKLKNEVVWLRYERGSLSTYRYECGHYGNEPFEGRVDGCDVCKLKAELHRVKAEYELNFIEAPHLTQCQWALNKTKIELLTTQAELTTTRQKLVEIKKWIKDLLPQADSMDKLGAWKGELEWMLEDIDEALPPDMRGE